MWLENLTQFSSARSIISRKRSDKNTNLHPILLVVLCGEGILGWDMVMVVSGQYQTCMVMHNVPFILDLWMYNKSNLSKASLEQFMLDACMRQTHPKCDSESLLTSLWTSFRDWQWLRRPHYLSVGNGGNANPDEFVINLFLQRCFALPARPLQITVRCKRVCLTCVWAESLLHPGVSFTMYVVACVTSAFISYKLS